MDEEKETAIKTMLNRLKFRPALEGITSANISVKSLAQISDKLDKFSKGEGAKRASTIITIVLCAFFISDILALLFEKYLPTPPVSRLALRQRGGSAMNSPMEYEVIINRNLFSSKSPTKSGNDIDMEAEPVLTGLPFQLKGTVILHDPKKSMGAIQDTAENRLYPIRVGDEIEGKAIILSVEARRVVFINPVARRKEYVALPEDATPKISYSSGGHSAPSSGVQEVQENNFVVKRSEIDSQLANWNTLIQQALAVPEMQGGQMVGFRLRQVQPGSFYEKLGIKQNDLITTVNGEKLTDVAKAAQLLNDLKTMNSLSLGINRNGKDTTLSYDIQ